MPYNKQPNAPKEELVLCADETVLKTAYSKRKLASIYVSVKNTEVDELLDQGWIPYKEGITRSRLHIPKDVHQCLVDDVWCLLYRMGYREMAGDDGVKIPFQDEHGDFAEANLPVVAIDDETCVVVECKTRTDRGRKSLAKDIEESKLIRKKLQSLLRGYPNGSSKRKILWIYATRNIIWQQADVEAAGEAKIRAITENEFQYFDTFIQHLGPAGRYQFLAEFFEGQEIPGLDDVRIPATQGVLGKNKFYSFVSTPRRLLKIAFVNHQALNHPDGHPAYQRMIAPHRIKQIQKFIEAGGYFPTNILVNFTKVCRFDLLPNKENSDPVTKFGWLYLPKFYKSAWIIDGQHRLYGYSHLSGKFLDRPINVVAFELLPTKDEAELFVTINHEQKSVPKSILVSLQADLRINSEKPKERLGAIASRIVKRMGGDPTSPFFQKFAVHGIPSTDSQSLTIPEFVQGLLRAGLLGKVVHGIHEPGALCDSTDEQTVRRASNVITAYFDMVRSANAVRWDAGRDGYIATNPGVRAFLLLLAAALRYLERKAVLDPYTATDVQLRTHLQTTIQPVLTFLHSNDEEKVKERFARRYGEAGVKDYFENLAESICEIDDDFGDEQLRRSFDLKKGDRIKAADEKVIGLSRVMLDTVVATLKSVYGTDVDKNGRPNYWEKGVKSANIKKAAYGKQLDDDSSQPIEAYLDIVDIKEIVKDKGNWPHFSATFNIPMPDERKGKAHYIDWIDKFNTLRRIPAHPSGMRKYSEDDYAFLEFSYKAFFAKVMAQT
jgi:DNA sulfur modification protein DndB